MPSCFGFFLGLFGVDDLMLHGQVDNGGQVETVEPETDRPVPASEQLGEQIMSKCC